MPRPQITSHPTRIKEHLDVDSTRAFWHRFGLVLTAGSIVLLALALPVLVPAHAREQARRKEAIARLFEAGLTDAELREELRRVVRRSERSISPKAAVIVLCASASIGAALMVQARKRAAAAAHPTHALRLREHWARFPDYRYSTFWPRFWAGLLDGLTLAPLNVLLRLLPARGTPAMATLLTVVQYAISFAYGIWLLTTRGQTVGKWLCRVKVLDASEQPMRPWQPWARDSIPLAISLLSAVRAVVMPDGSRLAAMAASTVTLWFMLEVVTMLSNRRRRAVHDWIARTVVVRVAD